MRNVRTATFISILSTIALLGWSDTNFNTPGGDWNNAAHWSAGVPGVSDSIARMNINGTLNVTAPPTVTSGIDFRINGSSGANVINWNPGSGTMTFDYFYIGGGGSGTANLTQDSGTIALSAVGTEQWRVGNNSPGTHTMNGNASVQFGEGMSIGHFANGDGHLIMNNNSTVTDTGNDNGGTFFGNNAAGARGTLTMNDDSVFFSRGQTHLGRANNSIGTIELNGNARYDARNEVLLGNGGTGQGWLVMGDNSQFRLSVGASDKDLRVGSGGSNSGTVLMSGSASILGDGAINDDISIGYSGDGTLIMDGDSSITSVRSFGIADLGTGSDATVTLNGNSRIDANVNFQVGRVGDGTITLNDNSSISTATTGPLRLAANVNATALLTMNGAGTRVSAAQNIDIASANPVVSTATFDQNAGEVYVAGAISIGNGVAGNAGTYNLDGGLLRANNINQSSTGIFNWGAGTMTVREVQQNASGDGSIISVTGDLTSSSGSTLDLQNLYSSGGVRFDKLAVSGALDLTSGGDVLDFWVNVQALRGTGGIRTGELQLISATSVAGTFDNIVAPGSDGLFFRTLLAGEIAQGTSADALTLNRGYLDYRTDGVYFVYKVNGQVPEPSTAAYWLIFVGLASAWRNRRRFSFFDFMGHEDDESRDY